ncbi:BEN domain-containing protein 2 [Echinops telfairi]|uniref:BEN domain-containing protein 2 n=1 Tax=Echinops telfairi TaxID=9371 RepID=A0AC55D4E1_ECHTE|nr:BEN domain-containing protein 2 [Echinops telfairi]
MRLARAGIRRAAAEPGAGRAWRWGHAQLHPRWSALGRGAAGGAGSGLGAAVASAAGKGRMWSPGGVASLRLRPVLSAPRLRTTKEIPVITIDGDSDDDDIDIVVVEDSDTQDADDESTVEPNNQGNQGALQRNHESNFETNHPESENEEFCPLNQKSRATLAEDCMALQELIDKTSRDVKNLGGLVSEMNRTLSEQLLPKDNNCRLSLPVQRQRNHGHTNLVGTSLQAAAHCEEQPILEEQEPVFGMEEEHQMEQELVPKMEESVPIVEDPVLREQPQPLLLLVEEPVLIEGEAVLREQEEIHRKSPPLPQIIFTRLLKPYLPSEIEDNNLENSLWGTNYSTIHSDQAAASSCFIIPNAGDFEMIPINEKLQGVSGRVNNSSETVNHSTSLGNENERGPFIPLSCSYSSSYNELEPIEILISKNTKKKNDSEATNNSVLLEDNWGRGSSSSAAGLFMCFSYLGDPERNVRMFDNQLVTAQRKNSPSCAARYLVSNLFSKEELMSSSVDINSEDHQPLDPNKLAAIREFLIMHFPNYDLSEYGEDWQNCISDIRVMIQHLCYEARKLKKCDDRMEGPLNLGSPERNEGFINCDEDTSNLVEDPVNLDEDHDRPEDADPDDQEDGIGSIPQSTTSLETRENEDALPTEYEDADQNNNDIVEEVVEIEADEVRDFEVTGFVGCPCRGIKLPQSVLDVARRKTRPDLSARYLIRILFPEEDLLWCNVYGCINFGLFALDPNRISAIREFLQETFPTFELEESGYDWKECVKAMNSCIRNIRYHIKKTAWGLQPLPDTDSSEDSDVTD